MRSAGHAGKAGFSGRAALFGVRTDQGLAVDLVDYLSDPAHRECLCDGSDAAITGTAIGPA